jgi:leucyl aminopeptidase
MPPAATPSVTVTLNHPSSVATDLLLVPTFEGEALEDIAGVREATGRAIDNAVAAGEFRGKPYEVFLTAVSGWGTPRLMLVGAGSRATFNTERLRKIATAGALSAKARRVKRIAFLLRGELPEAAAIQAVAEGLMLAAYNGDFYKSGERSGPPPAEMVIVVKSGEQTSLDAAARRGAVLGESCNIARDLCNEPPNVLTPAVLADRAAKIAKEAGLSVDVIDEKGIAALNMGLLLGVGQGSAQPPRLVVIKHIPKGAPDAPVLGLVGKGITFDTGGISIKPADGMDRMKTDMSGAAAVIGAMRAIALLKAPIKVVGVVPAAENMPGGRATRPSDILTSASGKTVEVVNTDAEGRLILGDALWYARELGATHLVDIATLTGACVVALGKVASGLFGQPDGWAEVVNRTAQRAGDRCWRLPLYEEYKEQIKSEIADMINSGGRPGGACTAALFLKEFVDDMPWVHLDIAGTAWAEDAKPWQSKGSTGVAVRTLAELAFTSSEWT